MKQLLLIIMLINNVSFADSRTKLHVGAGMFCQVATDFVVTKALHLGKEEKWKSMIMSVPMCALVSATFEGIQAQERNAPFDAGDQGAFMLGQALGLGLKFTIDW